MVLISPYVCIFRAILNNLSRGHKNVKYNEFDEQCQQWLPGATDNALTSLVEGLGFVSCQVTVFSFFCGRFVLFLFKKNIQEAFCSINLLGNNVTFDSKPKKARTHFLNLRLLLVKKINKGDLPLLYSCVFWCEFIDLVGFFGAVIVFRHEIRHFDVTMTYFVTKNASQYHMH